MYNGSHLLVVIAKILYKVSDTNDSSGYLVSGEYVGSLGGDLNQYCVKQLLVPITVTFSIIITTTTTNNNNSIKWCSLTMMICRLIHASCVSLYRYHCGSLSNYYGNHQRNHPRSRYLHRCRCHWQIIGGVYIHCRHGKNIKTALQLLNMDTQQAG